MVTPAEGPGQQFAVQLVDDVLALLLGRHRRRQVVRRAGQLIVLGHDVRLERVNLAQLLVELILQRRGRGLNQVFARSVFLFGVLLFDLKQLRSGDRRLQLLLRCLEVGLVVVGVVHVRDHQRYKQHGQNGGQHDKDFGENAHDDCLR
jgi:hypothetical protein